MPRNYYLGWSIEDLEAVRTSIQRALTTGQQTEIAIVGVRSVFDPSKNSDLPCQLDRVEYALYVADQSLDEPTNLYTNPYATRNRHTLPSFQ